MTRLRRDKSDALFPVKEDESLTAEVGVVVEETDMEANRAAMEVGAAADAIAEAQELDPQRQCQDHGATAAAAAVDCVEIGRAHV